MTSNAFGFPPDAAHDSEWETVQADDGPVIRHKHDAAAASKPRVKVCCERAVVTFDLVNKQVLVECPRHGEQVAS